MYALGLNLIIAATFNMACSHAEDGKLDFISIGLTINYKLLISDSTIMFCVLTWISGCSIVISTDMQ